MADKSEIIREAQKHLARGQVDRAIAEWEKLIKESPDANVFNTIGDLYLKKGDKKPAVEYFHKAASYFREEGFSLKALALYKKILNTDVSNVDSLVALGELSEEKGLVTDAIKYYLAAADVLSKETNKDRFVAIYEKILSIAPFNIPLREKVAGLFLKEGLVPNAIREQVNIAQLYEERGELDQAREYFRKVVDAQPENKDALLGLSGVCEKTGAVDEAIVYVKKALEISPDDFDLLLRCATLLKNRETYDESISFLSKALNLKPSDTASHRLLGDIYLMQGEKDHAWQSYKVVLDSAALEGDVEEAILIAGKFRDVQPVDAGRMLISLYKQKDDTESAFRETIFVAEQLSEAGEIQRAVEYYRDALKMRPDDINLKKALAEHERKAGISPEAAEEEEKTVDDLISEADIFIKYGLYDDALKILEELKVQEPTNMHVHAKLKSIYLETGDKEQAVTECIIISEIHARNGDVHGKDAALKEAFEINPDDPRIIERMPQAVEEEVAPAPEPAEARTLDDYAEELAEAEFYLRQGLNEDALNILKKLAGIFPDNETFRDKIAAIETPSIEPSALPQEQELPEEVKEGIPVQEEFVPEEGLDLKDIVEPKFDEEVLDIFNEFKKGLEKDLDAHDSETHYNLGIAYKEMGLVDDAIKEFQVSRTDPEYFIRAMSMLGICYMGKGLSQLAIDAFKGALEKIEAKDESFWGTKYDLALAYEMNGDYKEAFDIMSEIYGWDSGFREVADKVNALKDMASKEETKQKEKKSRISYL